jgi:hypothetical protein
MRDFALSLSSLSCRDLSLIFASINTVIIVGIVMGIVTTKNTKKHNIKIIGYCVAGFLGLLLTGVLVFFLNVLTFHGSIQ